eukprot:Rhum_TRINITY_DN174_c0_g1::Rhum_TRINITY_DN174_c0_g1_i1::g.534::m.534
MSAIVGTSFRRVRDWMRGLWTEVLTWVLWTCVLYYAFDILSFTPRRQGSLAHARYYAFVVLIGIVNPVSVLTYTLQGWGRAPYRYYSAYLPFLILVALLLSTLIPPCSVLPGFYAAHYGVGTVEASLRCPATGPSADAGLGVVLSQNATSAGRAPFGPDASYARAYSPLCYKAAKDAAVWFSVTAWDDSRFDGRNTYKSAPVPFTLREGLFEYQMPSPDAPTWRGSNRSQGGPAGPALRLEVTLFATAPISCLCEPATGAAAASPAAPPVAHRPTGLFAAKRVTLRGVDRLAYPRLPLVFAREVDWREGRVQRAGVAQPSICSPVTAPPRAPDGMAGHVTQDDWAAFFDAAGLRGAEYTHLVGKKSVADIQAYLAAPSDAEWGSKSRHGFWRAALEGFDGASAPDAANSTDASSAAAAEKPGGLWGTFTEVQAEAHLRVLGANDTTVMQSAHNGKQLQRFEKAHAFSVDSYRYGFTAVSDAVRHAALGGCGCGCGDNKSLEQRNFGLMHPYPDSGNRHLYEFEPPTLFHEAFGLNQRVLDQIVWYKVLLWTWWCFMTVFPFMFWRYGEHVVRLAHEFHLSVQAHECAFTLEAARLEEQQDKGVSIPPGPPPSHHRSTLAAQAKTHKVAIIHYCDTKKSDGSYDAATHWKLLVVGVPTAGLCVYVSVVDLASALDLNFDTYAHLEDIVRLALIVTLFLDMVVISVPYIARGLFLWYRHSLRNALCRLCASARGWWRANRHNDEHDGAAAAAPSPDYLADVSEHSGNSDTLLVPPAPASPACASRQPLLPS